MSASVKIYSTDFTSQPDRWKLCLQQLSDFTGDLTNRENLWRIDYLRKSHSSTDKITLSNKLVANGIKIRIGPLWIMISPGRRPSPILEPNKRNNPATARISPTTISNRPRSCKTTPSTWFFSYDDLSYDAFSFYASRSSNVCVYVRKAMWSPVSLYIMNFLFCFLLLLFINKQLIVKKRRASATARQTV